MYAVILQSMKMKISCYILRQILMDIIQFVFIKNKKNEGCDSVTHINLNAMKEHTKLMLVEEEKLWQEYKTKRDTLGIEHKETQHAFALYNLMLKLLKDTL